VGVVYRTAVAIIAALIVSAQVAMPAMAQTVPGPADVTRLQNAFENGNKIPQKPESAAPFTTPQHALPSEAMPENAEAITFTLKGIELQGSVSL